MTGQWVGCLVMVGYVLTSNQVQDVMHPAVHHRHSEGHLKANPESGTRVTGNLGHRTGTGSFSKSLGGGETGGLKERALCLRQGVGVAICGSGSTSIILRILSAEGNSSSRDPRWLLVPPCTFFFFFATSLGLSTAWAY